MLGSRDPDPQFEPTSDDYTVSGVPPTGTCSRAPTKRGVSTVPKPACLATYTAAAIISSACKCLSIPVFTSTATSYNTVPGISTSTQNVCVTAPNSSANPAADSSAGHHHVHHQNRNPDPNCNNDKLVLQHPRHRSQRQHPGGPKHLLPLQLGGSGHTLRWNYTAVPIHPRLRLLPSPSWQLRRRHRSQRLC